MDLSKEAIIYTQESTIAEDEVVTQEKLIEPHVGVHDGGATAGNTLKTQEIRRSDRLKKDIVVTTQEKTEMMTRKRNLEGTTSSSTMFSDLPVETLKNLSNDIGIAAHQISFGTFDILRDLENARRNLQSKKHEAMVTDFNEDKAVEDDINERLIEWLKDDLSETESDILAQSKNQGKLSKRKPKISPKNKKISQDQEDLGLRSGKTG